MGSRRHLVMCRMEGSEESRRSSRRQEVSMSSMCTPRSTLERGEEFLLLPSTARMARTTSTTISRRLQS